MPDFSGASLKLKAEGEEKVLATLDRIDKKARDSFGGYSRLSQDELNKASAAFDALYGKQSKSAAKSAESVAAAMEQSAARQARSLTGIARGFEMVTRTGTLTGRSLDSVAVRASELALGFGATGYIVGAIAIGGGAIVEAFHKWDVAIENTKRLLSELNEEHVKLVAEAQGNSLGAKELELANQYLKKVQEIEKNRPGFFSRIASELVTGAGTIIGSESLIQYGASLFPVAQLRSDLALRQAGANLLQGDKNISAEDAKKQAQEAEQAEDKHISALSAIIKLQSENGGALAEADRLIQKYTASLRNANLTEEQRAKILERINTLNAAEKTGESSPYKLTELPAFKSPFGLSGIPADFLADISPAHQLADELNPDRPQAKADQFAIEENVRRTIEGLKNTWFAQADQLAKEMQQRVGQTIGDALFNGFQTAFQRGSNIGKGIQDLTRTVLSGLGSMFMQIAEKALIASQFMQKIVGFLTTNPWLAAAAAVAMMAFASQLGGAGGGGGGGSYGGSYGGGTVIDRGIINPIAPTSPVTPVSSITPRPTNNFYNTIIGVNDASAQRQLQEMIRKANARGSA